MSVSPNNPNDPENKEIIGENENEDDEESRDFWERLEEEEGKEPNMRLAPKMPTPDEIERHYVTHIPFRSWCPECVKGKAKDYAHRRVEEHGEIPVVSTDYMFITRQDGSSMPLLTFKCNKTKHYSAIVVKNKGANEYAIRRSVEVLKYLAHSRVIYRSDQEPAILELKSAVINEMKQQSEIKPESTPVGDSQSNGIIEKANQDLREQIMTMYGSLKSRYKEGIDEEHGSIPWMVSHAAACMSRFKVGADGKTAYHRVNGKDFKKNIVEFGECIWYLRAESKHNKTFDSRWKDGVFYGVTDTSGEIIVGTKDGVLKARSFRRKPESLRWDWEFFKEVKGTPWEPIPGREGIEIKSRVTMPEDIKISKVPEGEEREIRSRRVRILKSDIERFGFTQNCAGCRSINRGGKPMNHSEACRKRIEEQLEKEGSQRLKDARERNDHDIAEQIEKNIARSSTDKPEDKVIIAEQSEEKPEDVEMEDGEINAESNDNEDMAIDIHEIVGETPLLSVFDEKPGLHRQNQVIQWLKPRHQVFKDKMNRDFRTHRANKEAKDYVRTAMDRCVSLNRSGGYFVLEQCIAGNSWDEHKFGTWIRSNRFKHKNMGDICLITNSDEIFDGIEAIDRGGFKKFVMKNDWRRENEAFDYMIRKMVMRISEKIDADERRIHANANSVAIEEVDEDNRWIDEEQDYYDDISGERLPSHEVNKARADEIEQIKIYGLYTKVPISECLNKTGKKPLKTRWVDVNKGDKTNPDYRSRLVAKEIKRDKRLDLFAATPPLECKKMLFSFAVTNGIGFVGNRKDGMKIDFIDVSRAYFHAPVRREVYIELPIGDEQEGMCGRLNMSMYGTRDAAQNWEYAYSNFLQSLGFKNGTCNPCIFYHGERDLRLVVHGDDFTVLGYADNLDWFRKQNAERFKVKFRDRLGPSDDDDKSIRILIRIVQWDEEGIKYEADQRHSEIVVKTLGFNGRTKHVTTPGDEDCQKIVPDDEECLDSSYATTYRGLAARLTYLAQDRSDTQYAVKEVARGMSKPTKRDLRRIKRLARYMCFRPRMVVRFDYQNSGNEIAVWTDSDFAGCRTSRKSTSGGVCMFGIHCWKTWSSTQGVIALSSGEAEYYSLVKGCTIGIGMKGIMSDFGIDTKVGLRTDASAAIGIASRRGFGKVRHIEVNQLWLQQKIAEGTVTVKKIAGNSNLADAMTKYVGNEILSRHIAGTGHYCCEGRHPLAPVIDDETLA